MSRTIIRYIKSQGQTETPASPSAKRSGSPVQSQQSVSAIKNTQNVSSHEENYTLNQLYSIFNVQTKEDLFSKLAILNQSKSFTSLIIDDIQNVKNNLVEFKTTCYSVKQKIEKSKKRFSSFLLTESETLTVAVEKMQKLFTVRFRKGQMSLDLQDKKILNDQEYYKSQILEITENNKLIQQQITALKNYVPEPSDSQPVSRRASMQLSQLGARTQTLNLNPLDSSLRASSVSMQSMRKSLRPGQRGMAGMIYGPRAEIEMNHLELLQKFNELQNEHQQALYRIIRAEQEQRKMQRSRSNNVDTSLMFTSRSNSNAISRQGKTNEETIRGIDGISQIHQQDSMMGDGSMMSNTGDASIVKALKAQVKQLYKQVVEKQEQLRYLQLNEHKIQGYDKVVQLYNQLNQKIEQQQQLIQRLKAENNQYNQQIIGLSEQLNIVSSREQRATKHNMARNNQLSTLNKILKAENTQLKAQMVQHSTVEEISSERDSFASIEPENKRRHIMESDTELLRSKSNQVSQLKLKNVEQSQALIQKERLLKEKNDQIQILQKQIRQLKKIKYGDTVQYQPQEQETHQSHIIENLNNQLDEQNALISSLQDQVEQQKIQIQESKYAKHLAQQELQDYKERQENEKKHSEEALRSSNSGIDSISSSSPEKPNEPLNVIQVSKSQQPIQPFNNQPIIPANSGAFALSSNDQTKDEDKLASSQVRMTSPLSIPHESIVQEAEKLQKEQKQELKKYKVRFTVAQCLVFVGFMILSYYILRSQFMQTQNDLYQQYTDCTTSLQNCQNKFDILRQGLNVTQEKLSDYLSGYDGLQQQNDNLIVQNSRMRFDQIMYMSIIGILGAVVALSVKYLIDRVFL